MNVWPDDYIQFVVNDIEKYKYSRKLKKTSLIERCVQHYLAPSMLHPNPGDEFSQPEIGPNLEIVSEYIKVIRYNPSDDMPIFEEPIVVQKMDPDGYMLINGHHRWFAAMRMKVKKVHVQIVNLIDAQDVTRMLDCSSNDKIAAFDLDEVLLSCDESNQAPIHDSLFRKKISRRLRKGAPDVIRALQEMGYDIWVYSAGYMDEESINDFFSMYDIAITGMMNGMNEKRTNNAEHTNTIKEMMTNKYKKSLHIDNESIFYGNRITKDFQQFDLLTENAAWSDEVLKILKDLQ